MALRAVAPSLPGSWGVFALSANQTMGLAVNNPIRFDTVKAGNLMIGGYAITLPAGGIYRLSSSLGLGFSANNGSAQTAWYNVTAGTTVGQSARHLPPTNTTAATSQPISLAVVDTTAGAVSVQLRITAATSLNNVASAFCFAEVTSVG